jgi:hypothetical protein
MQQVFLFILMAALACATLVLGWLGLTQRRRQTLLARGASELGLKFSLTDPFDLTRRHHELVLASAGHNMRAENVIYGRYGGWVVRVFDYQFEAGHGPGRLVRRYTVAVAETDMELPPALIWHERDNELVPLAASRGGVRGGPWFLVAGGSFAGLLAECFKVFADEPVNVQTAQRAVMLASAGCWKPADLPARLGQFAQALGELRQRWVGPSGPAGGGKTRGAGGTDVVA